MASAPTPHLGRRQTGRAAPENGVASRALGLPPTGGGVAQAYGHDPQAFASHHGRAMANRSRSSASTCSAHARCRARIASRHGGNAGEAARSSLASAPRCSWVATARRTRPRAASLCARTCRRPVARPCCGRAFPRTACAAGPAPGRRWTRGPTPRTAMPGRCARHAAPQERPEKQCISPWRYLRATDVPGRSGREGRGTSVSLAGSTSLACKFA